ncbi:MAG: DEAD/DEAH box helicase, partial [Turicibacter sp.]
MIEDIASDRIFEHNQKLVQFKNILECVTLIHEINTQIKGAIPSFIGIEYETLSEISGLYRSIELAQVKLKLEKWHVTYDGLLTDYKLLLMKEQMHGVCVKLYDALVEKDTIAFSELLVHIQVLMKIKEQYVIFYDLLNGLKAVTPLFANQILNDVEVKELLPGSIQDIFEFGKLTTYLNELDGWKMEELEQKLEMLENEEKNLVRQLIFKLTWKNQLDHVTPEQDRSLQIWMQKMARIGKGTGKNAERYRREARSEMEKCQSAIPVWIMPVKEAIENFKVNPDLFDVVIVDESSQCNVLSLPILMRAKKAVIVGDDQQISPLIPGINETQVSELIGRYLYQIENGNSYDMQTSLYDVATHVFSSKGKLMLKEHFRCVPEIIGFSNELCYHNEMIPLKVPLVAEQLNPPVMAIYIEDGKRSERKTNLLEAMKIVEDIKSLIEDPMYFNKTMG